MSIADFKGQLKGGGARPNRFKVMVEFPSFAGTVDDTTKTQFLCISTQLPGSTLGVIEIPFRGRTLKLPGDRVFDEWTCSFINDTGFELRNAFERWHNGINAYNSNSGSVVPDEVMSNVTISQLGSDDTVLKTYTLKLTWPSVIGPIEVGQDQTDTYEQFDVTFVFSDLESNTTT